MKRRSLFQLLAGATAAAAMEVCGLLPSRKAEVVFDAVSAVGEFHWRNIMMTDHQYGKSRWNSILERAPFPEGMGNTIQTVQNSQKS